MNSQGGESRIKRELTQDAISFAMQGRWDEAIEANKSTIEIFPNDVNALNRLGKALTEKGLYDEAIKAYSRAVEIEPRNSIARKNLRRLSMLKEAQSAPAGESRKPIMRAFIEETGKAGVARLDQLAPREVLVRMAPGDTVHLKVQGQGLVVENEQSEYLGMLDPRISVRLFKLMEGGNQYGAAVASLSDGGFKVLITETYQHPSQIGRPSFPAKVSDGFRSYVKGSILKYELGEDEDVYDDSGEVVDTDEDVEVLPDGMTLMSSEAEPSLTAEEET